MSIVMWQVIIVCERVQIGRIHRKVGKGEEIEIEIACTDTRSLHITLLCDIIELKTCILFAISCCVENEDLHYSIIKNNSCICQRTLIPLLIKLKEWS